MLEPVLKGGGLRRGGLAPEAAALIPRGPSPGAAVACRPGQEVKVKVIGIDDNGRINLSIKKAMDPPPRPAGQGRPAGGMGGGRPPRPGNGGRSQGGFRRQTPAEPTTFEDRLKQFMQASDSKLSELHYVDKRSGSRRGGRK